MYSWPGGAKFETNNPDDLLGGSFAGNERLASFIITAFGSTLACCLVGYEEELVRPGTICVFRNERSQKLKPNSNARFSQ